MPYSKQLLWIFLLNEHMNFLGEIFQFRWSILFYQIRFMNIKNLFSALFYEKSIGGTL